jgi:hypothetical protein
MKKLMAVMAVLAFVASTVPAMALENEFHGMFRAKLFVSNFDDSKGATSANAPLPISDEATTKTYMEQRARLLYTAKASDDLKLITHFEIDSRWGDSAYTNGRGAGAGLGADQVNLETKNVYLDFNIPGQPTNFKVGIQPFADAFKGVFVNNDMAGVALTQKMDPLTIGVGFYRWDDEVAAAPGPFNPGHESRDFLVADAKFAVDANTLIGGSYYLVTDDRDNDNLLMHMVGVNGTFKFDPMTLDVFAAYQFGDASATTDLSAYGAGAVARMKQGDGTLKATAIFLSGDDQNSSDNEGFQTISSAGGGENNFYPADMMILLRNKYEMNTARAVVYDMANDGDGVAGLFLGYDLSVDKVYGSVNGGYLQAAHAPGDDYIGCEINGEIGYKLYDNMTAAFQAAYAVLNEDYYLVGGAKIDDPYTTRIMLNYTF